MTVEKNDNGTIYSDPSMVMVGFSRPTHAVGADGVSLFGSSIKNSSVVSLTIYPAYIDRHLSQDWHHAKTQPIIEVLLSPLQFAELLTTLNIGFGVPATLVQHEGKHYELPKIPSKAEQFRDEVADDFRKIVNSLVEAQKII